MDTYQEFVYLRTYSRFLWAEGRREIWPETVNRYIDFMFRNPLIPEKVRRKSLEKILALDVAPSMRALWTAGEAAESDNAVMYNCSYLAVNSPEAFGEALYLLMCGTGVGFSVEKKHIDQLPVIRHQRNVPVERCAVEDSRIGWKNALDRGIQMWLEGRDIYFDFSLLRPMGAPLRTMGGRSSGPDVLRQLMGYTRESIMAAQGRQLTPIECHDIMCEIASVVIVGGVRRSALISLSDLNDEQMRVCKVPPFHGRRNGANVSAVYYRKPEDLEFLKEWAALGASGTGERGIINLGAARANAPHRRKSKLITGTNPCAEIALRDREFCNLTEVIVREHDDFDSIRDKITTATWLGVIQSTFTDFQGISPLWQQNCEDERLTGVSLTGQMDRPSLLSEEVLRLWKAHAVKVARKASQILGINMPAATTCVKPSGTVSKVAGSASGLHPRWSQYYLQNTQIAKTDPLFRLMADQGVPYFDTPGADHTAVIPFPIKAPDGAVTRHDMTAIDQLEHYKKVVKNWCEHNASCTVYVGENEWIQVAAWVHDNFGEVSGVSFFPRDESKNNYAWTPQQEITEQEYEAAIQAFPQINFSRLPEYESGDTTEGAKTYACSAGACEL